jgi:hypothetical protein
MAQGQRATAVLNYLEKQDSKTVINILNPMLDDEALELYILGWFVTEFLRRKAMMKNDL